MTKLLPGHPYHRLPNESLLYIVKDASEAQRAVATLGDERNANKYADQVNDAASILGARERGEVRQTGVLRKNDKLKTRGGYEVEVLAVCDKPLSNGDAIVGLLDWGTGDGPEVNTWKGDGRFRHKGFLRLDLVLVPEELP